MEAGGVMCCTPRVESSPAISALVGQHIIVAATNFLFLGGKMWERGETRKKAACGLHSVEWKIKKKRGKNKRTFKKNKLEKKDKKKKMRKIGCQWGWPTHQRYLLRLFVGDLKRKRGKSWTKFLAMSRLVVGQHIISNFADVHHYDHDKVHNSFFFFRDSLILE